MTFPRIQRCSCAVVRVVVLIGLTLVLATCTWPAGLQKQVVTLGTLRVALINSATTYFTRGQGPAGFEYDLVNRFAQQLGLRLEVIGVPNRRAAIAAIRSGRAHMAAGLAVSAAAQQQVHFTPPYSIVELDVVYNTANPAPKKLADIDSQLTIRAHSALGEALERLHPMLVFDQRLHANAEGLMAAVAHGKIYSTIASNDLVAINQHYYPELRVAFTLPDIKRELAWAFPQHNGRRLYNGAVAWLERAKASGQIKVLRQRYFGHGDRIGFVDGRIFAQQIEQRLPEWKTMFEHAAATYYLDWRLLAAISYQESHWDPQAVSPTGVRGLMMLTQATANDLGVSNRLVPKQSINGGARYLIQQRNRLPDSIHEPDRTWMAMAAYNVGFGHVMDARRLLEAHGKNPDLWANVRKALTQLTKRKYYEQTRYGYARGYQAVEYVGNIRAYYDILRWVTRDREQTDTELADETPAPQPTIRPDDAVKRPPISIVSPAL